MTTTEAMMTRCESGWTGDRCTFPLFHDGPHSNEQPTATTRKAPMTADELEARTATFATYAEARAAADGALPRRKHNRPAPAYSGRLGAWIVWVGNVILLTDGSMYDHQLARTIGARR